MDNFKDNQRLQALLERHFERFSPLQQKIIVLRFGLRNGAIHSIEEIGRTLGLSREEIRQQEAAILHRVRQDNRSGQGPTS